MHFCANFFFVYRAGAFTILKLARMTKKHSSASSGVLFTSLFTREQRILKQK